MWQLGRWDCSLALYLWRVTHCVVFGTPCWFDLVSMSCRSLFLLICLGALLCVCGVGYWAVDWADKGLPGWPALCIFGGSFSVGVFAILTFNPSAIFLVFFVAFWINQWCRMKGLVYSITLFYSELCKRTSLFDNTILYTEYILRNV